MKHLIGDYDSFIANINAGLETLRIEAQELSMMDHICYRVETTERYQELLGTLGEVATLLGENEVSGRQIATFEFQEYLRSGGWTVPYLELPEPKEGSPYAEGLEHVEFVVIGSLEKFMKRHNDIAFSTKGMNKLINPEAGVKAEGISVKFHEQQLGAVVRIENSLAGLNK